MDQEALLLLLAILALLAISAFFSGSETALTAVSRARIHHLSGLGVRRAAIASQLIGNPERLIGAVLLGNNLVTVLASSIATSFLLSVVGDAGVAYATLVMTALIVVFAEVLPKTYAITNSDRVALAVAPAIRIATLVLGPILAAIQFLVRWMLGLFGVDIEASRPVLSAREELRGVIDLHEHEGGVVKGEADMLGGILDLDEVSVTDVMVHRRNMTMIELTESASEILKEAARSPFTRIPLWRDDPENIVGVLHTRDLLRAVAEREGDLSGIDVLALASEPWFVPETTTLREQLNAFRHRRSHFALVVDEYGALMGLVTLEDIIEEIVGDIADEHDVAVSGVRPQPDGSYILDGWVAIRDLNREFDWDLPDEEATTIAGLVIHEAQTIPEPGQTFAFHGFTFEILRRQRNQITAIRVTPPSRSEAA